MGFNLDAYEPVEARIARFWKDHPEGRIVTELVYNEDKRFIVRADVFFDRDDARPVTTGYAEEIVGATPVNRTSALENCETSAIGRALANANYQTDKRPSREEMQKVQRRTKSQPVEVAVQVEDAVPATPEQAETLSKVAELVFDTMSKKDLRAIWEANTDVLDVEFDHAGATTSLRRVILFQIKELETPDAQ